MFESEEPVNAPEVKEALALFVNCAGLGKEATFTLKDTVTELPAAILPIAIPVLGLAAATVEPLTVTLPATKAPRRNRVRDNNVSNSDAAWVGHYD